MLGRRAPGAERARREARKGAPIRSSHPGGSAAAGEAGTPRAAAFGRAPDPDDYVPTRAAEGALERLDRSLRGEGRGAVALTGPPGAGKTTALLAWAARRAPETRVVVLPHAALPCDEICAWVLGLLGAPLDDAPEAALRRAARRALAETGRPLVVALDDADALPLASVHRLAALLAEAEGALRLLLVASDRRPSRSLAALGLALAEVRLASGMSLEETTRYVRAKLERAGRAEAAGRAPFDAEGLALLHRATGGLPGHVESVAEAFARGPGAVPRPAVPARSDPFTAAADPEGYVARPATERALAEIEAALAGGAPAVALVGPPGMGRTLLLRLVAQRERGRHHPVLLPYPALDAGELARLALGLAGERPGEAPEEELAELAARTAREGRALLLLLDDAEALPEEAWPRLAELLRRAEGALRLVAVLRAGDPAAERGGPLAEHLPGARTVRLDAPLDAEETAHYLSARLERAGAPRELRRLFEGEAARALHRASGGVPRELHRQADARIRAHGPAPDAPASAERAPRASGPPVRPAERTASAPSAARPRRRRAVAALLLAAALAGAGAGASLTGLDAPGELLDWLRERAPWRAPAGGEP